MKQTQFPSTSRASYTYHFADGTTSTVYVGDIDENGCVITEEMIELLYALDEAPCDEIQLEESEKADYYTYTFSDGTTSTVRVGGIDENGAIITADMIRLLHQMDDKEIYNNRKNTKTPIGKWEVPGINRWKAAHPGEPLPTRYHIPLDTLTKSEEGDNDCDKGNLAKASLSDSSVNEELKDDIDRLHEVVAMMSPAQQWVYKKIFVEGYTMTALAAELGTTKMAVSRRVKRIQNFIKKNF